MADAQMPDISKWPEAKNLGRAFMTDKKELICLIRYFFHYDIKHADERMRKLMQKCLVFYAFGIEEMARLWNRYEEDGKGGIKMVIYSALRLNRKKNIWVIGLLDQIVDFKIDFAEDGRVARIAFILKTPDGVKTVYAAAKQNPNS